MSEGSPPLGVIVFGSGSGTNLKALIDAQDGTYKVLAVFSDRPCRCQEIAKAYGIPGILHEKRVAKGKYDEDIVELLRPFQADLIVLAGYMKLVREPLLEAYPGKIINVHPADLTRCDSSGKRKYIGLNGVYDALVAGEKETCSTVIQVDASVDGGPILVLGPSVPYTGPYPVTPESAQEHQEKQKKESDWPALIETVKGIATKRGMSCVV